MVVAGVASSTYGRTQTHSRIGWVPPPGYSIRPQAAYPRLAIAEPPPGAATSCEATHDHDPSIQAFASKLSVFAYCLPAFAVSFCQTSRRRSHPTALPPVEPRTHHFVPVISFPVGSTSDHATEFEMVG